MFSRIRIHFVFRIRCGICGSHSVIQDPHFDPSSDPLRNLRISCCDPRSAFRSVPGTRARQDSRNPNEICRLARGRLRYPGTLESSQARTRARASKAKLSITRHSVVEKASSSGSRRVVWIPKICPGSHLGAPNTIRKHRLKQEFSLAKIGSQASGARIRLTRSSVVVRPHLSRSHRHFGPPVRNIRQELLP